MRGYRIAVVTLASLLCFSAAWGTPVVLFDTFGPGDSYLHGGTNFGTTSVGEFDLGFQFRFTGTAAYQLAAIDVGATLVSGNNVLDIWLMSDVGGQPGSIIESFTHTGAMGPFGPVDQPPVVATSVLQPILTPDTPYWLVLSAPTGTDAVWNIGIDPGLMIPEVCRTNEGPWSGGSGPRGAAASAGAFRITGTLVPTPIPAPAAMLLGAVGVGFVSWLRRRRAL